MNFTDRGKYSQMRSFGQPSKPGTRGLGQGSALRSRDGKLSCRRAFARATRKGAGAQRGAAIVARRIGDLWYARADRHDGHSKERKRGPHRENGGIVDEPGTATCEHGRRLAK